MSEEGGILAKPPKLFIRPNKKSKTSVSKVQEWRIESRPTKKKKKPTSTATTTTKRPAVTCSSHPQHNRRNSIKKKRSKKKEKKTKPKPQMTDFNYKVHQ